MSKLHEVLAVEANLKGQATTAINTLKNAFEKKQHLFGSKITTFYPDKEGSVPTTEEQSDIQTSVASELKWLSGIITKAIDGSAQIDEANTRALADIVLENNQILLKSVPATSLLSLEKYIKDVQELLIAIPTLDPAKGFKPDEEKGKGIYQARQVTVTRTKKTKEVITLAPATEHHPAQVALMDVDVPIGKITSQEWSSKITPAQKSFLLDKCDVVLRAIRKARARANETEVDNNVKIGNTLLDYILAL